MIRTLRSKVASRPEDPLGDIRSHLAMAMVGSTVDLLADHHTVAHGIVTGVFMMAGSPKIIVNGRTYDINQVLTATPGGTETH
ncbi:MAG: hypothetical protein U1F98_08040 [Verrucomicrobiota bacterium]